MDRNFTFKTTLRWMATLLLLLTFFSNGLKAQVLYTLSTYASANQLRSINANGTGDALIKENFAVNAGPLVYDLGNNRVLVADVTDAKIVSVSLATGNATSTFLTVPFIAGSSYKDIAGLAIDTLNDYLYYTLDDRNPTSTLDQLRRVNLDGTGDVLIKDNFIQEAGVIALDIANNRILVADAGRTTSSATIAKIVAVSLSAGNAVTTLITPTFITGSIFTTVSGLTVDRVNNYIYYALYDGSTANMLDQLRRTNLNGSGDVLIKDDFIQWPGEITLDAINNQVIMVEARASQSTGPLRTKIIAVSLATGNPVDTLIIPAPFSSSFSTIVGGLTLVNQYPLITGTLPGSTLCAGAQLAVPYKSFINFSSGNVFTAQLSNASGSFAAPVNLGTLNSTASSGTINITIPIGTTTGSGYRIRVVASNTATIGTDNGVNFTITSPSANATSQYLAAASTTQSLALTQNVRYYFADGSCRGILSLVPTGAAMGATTAKLYVQSTAPTYNTSKYVRRYYDISPATNAATATATVTLYYTQADFNDYNANNGSAPNLPTGSGDAAGISNLKITQQHGTSTTGLPGSYTGWSGSGPANVLINPADNNIVWNSAAARWEVTFNATGFSGFFAYGATNTVLPIRLTSFTAKEEGPQNRLAWKTAGEAVNGSFVIERSTDGNRFYEIGRRAVMANSTEYVFTDSLPASLVTYYRLKMIEDGRGAEYSATVAVRRKGNNSITLVPVPSINAVTVTNYNAVNNGKPAVVYDMTGREVHRFVLQATQTIDLSSWSTGLYSLRLADGSSVPVVKQ